MGRHPPPGPSGYHQPRRVVPVDVPQRRETSRYANAMSSGAGGMDGAPRRTSPSRQVRRSLIARSSPGPTLGPVPPSSDRPLPLGRSRPRHARPGFSPSRATSAWAAAVRHIGTFGDAREAARPVRPAQCRPPRTTRSDVPRPPAGPAARCSVPGPEARCRSRRSLLSARTRGRSRRSLLSARTRGRSRRSLPGPEARSRPATWPNRHPGTTRSLGSPSEASRAADLSRPEHVTARISGAKARARRGWLP